MAGPRPSILVVDDHWGERAAIVSVLREAGFAVVAPTQQRGASAALGRAGFAAMVLALPEGDGIAFLRQARHRQPGLKALLVVEPAAMRLVDEDSDALVTRPFDPRQLLGRVFELVLREDKPGAAPTTPRHSDAAEFGIAAAKLACLSNRHATAAANGASRLAQDLTRQIGETRAIHRGLAAAMNFGGRAVMRCPPANPAS